jgi:hypothetical protein
MSKEINEKKVKDLIHSIGLKNNLTDEQVRNIVESQFRFTYETIKNIPIEELSNEEVTNLKKTFYYKYLGKLYTTEDIIRKQKEKINKNQKEEDVRTEEN